MKKMIWFTSLIVLFAVFILPGLLALGIKYVPYANQPSLDKVKDIYGKYFISQEFTSQEGELTGIAMTIKNPNLKNKKDFFFDLYDESGNKLREVKFSGMNVEDGSYLKFLFDPIVDSKGKTYKIVLTNPDASPEEVLGVYYSDNKPSWVGTMKFNEEEAPGGISLVTFHKPQSRLAVIKEIYSSWAKRVLELK